MVAAVAKIRRVGKRRRPGQPPPEEPAGEPSGGRTRDRHASAFMARLPEIYRTQIRKYQELHRLEHKFRPTITDVLQVALEEFLAQQGLWPPEEEGGAE
jgi:hypothetical protein